MLSLFEIVAHSNCDGVLLQTFLKTCTEHQAFVNKAPVILQSVVANINGKLNSTSTRYDGLLLLKTFLPQCPVEIFGKNVISWIQQCLKSIDGRQNKQALASASYQALKIILQMSQQMPEMKRTVSGSVVSKIIDAFQQIAPLEVSLSMLECLEVLMCNYGPSCGQHKNVLEKCVLQYVDSSDANVIKRVAHCVAFLPLLGGGGSLGANHVSRWKQEHQKVCATLHYILDELFDSVREIPNSHSSVTSDQVLSLPSTSETVPLPRVYQLMNRFINVSKFLQAILLSEFPVEKTVLPDEILGIVCRGLAVTSHTMGKKVSADLLMVGAMLPQIHVALLKVLDSLITCCGNNLLPYAPVICKLVLQTLKWTSAEKWAYGIEKPYGQLRVAACNTLMLWLQTSNCGSCVELISEELVSFLLQDIWFEKEAVALSVQYTSNKKEQKYKRNTSEQQQGVETSRKYIPDQKSNSKTCRAALRVLQWMLHSAAMFIKPTTHRLLQEKTVGLLFDIQRASSASDLPFPYAETSCRLELYRLLHTLVIEPHATWPPPTQFAVHMLSAGRSDPNLKVSSFCTSALIAAEKLVHPASGTLHFPVSLEEMLESTKSTKRFKQEYLTKAKESSSFVETSEEEEASKGVHNRGGSDESEQATSHINNAPSSPEEVVIVYEDRMEVQDDGDETDESEEQDVSADSEESGSSVKNKVSQSYELSKTLSKMHDDQEITLVNISESDEELQHKEERSASSVVISNKSGSCSSVEACERDMSKTYNSKTDSTSPVSCNREKSVTVSAGFREKVAATSRDLGNKNKLIYQQQKESNISNASIDNRYENIIQASMGKGSKDIATNIKTSTISETHLVTENEEERQNDSRVLHIFQRDDDNESNPKKIKLDTPESVKKYYKLDTETPETSSQSKVKNSTAVPMTGNGRQEQPVNGVAQDAKDVTEEEMLQAFVDVLSE